MKAAEIIIKRAACYASGDFAGVYELYSSKSEFLEFFQEAAHYIAHAEEVQSKCSVFKELTILEEKSRGNLAQVVYTESFEEEGAHLRYLTTSVLIRENGCWRILSEKRVQTDF